jgi:hypothetical protein
MEDRHAHEKAYRKHFLFAGYRMGNQSLSIFNAGGGELMDWLAKQTPVGATIADTMAAIAIDAMHDEVDSKK